MRMDLEMLELVTGAFLGAEESDTDWNTLRESLPDDVDDNTLIEHLELLHSDGYLVSPDSSAADAEAKPSISALNLRLSEEGRRLARALHTPGAAKFIRKFAKDAGLTLELVASAIQAGSPIDFKLPE